MSVVAALELAVKVVGLVCLVIAVAVAGGLAATLAAAGVALLAVAYLP